MLRFSLLETHSYYPSHLVRYFHFRVCHFSSHLLFVLLYYFSACFKRKNILVFTGLTLLCSFLSTYLKVQAIIFLGIWDWQLKDDYRDKYKEELPDDFLKIIDMSPCIQLEKCSENYIVRHCEPGKVSKIISSNTVNIHIELLNLCMIRKVPL